MPLVCKGGLMYLQLQGIPTAFLFEYQIEI